MSPKLHISYYMPFKPMGHKNPSGDLIMGSELFSFLQNREHQIELASSLRCRWLYYKPWKWGSLLKSLTKLHKEFRANPPKIWLTYHSYYKAPDLLGPALCKKHKIPYVIFQGIYSTKRRKKLKTWPGFHLNRYSLSSADLVFTNKQVDRKNLLRLLPEEKVIYIPPGLHPNEFQFDLVSRRSLRNRWQSTDKRIVFTAAMFRPGVKTKGILQVINSCTELIDQGIELLLVIAGDGTNKKMLREYAKKRLGNNVLFIGKVPRYELYRYYSAADVFAFPGIQESLGMVYLEAQACGLPVIACSNWGASEAVIDKVTGHLSPYSDKHLFTENISSLLTNDDLRKTMRDNAKKHVQQNHNIEHNYVKIEETLLNLKTSPDTTNPENQPRPLIQ